MMNKKQMTLPLSMAGFALLAMIMAMSSPIQALALGHWNLDEDFTSGAGIAEDSSGTVDNGDGEDEEDTTAATNDEDEDEGSEDSGDVSRGNEDSTQMAYDDFQACLSNVEGGSPTEQQVLSCVESSYVERNSNEEGAMESMGDDDEEEPEMTDDASNDNTQNEEDQDS